MQSEFSVLSHLIIISVFLFIFALHCLNFDPECVNVELMFFQENERFSTSRELLSEVFNKRPLKK